jgi:hypothetical protein
MLHICCRIPHPESRRLGKQRLCPRKQIRLAIEVHGLFHTRLLSLSGGFRKFEASDMAL